jgi:hypothetical protein
VTQGTRTPPVDAAVSALDVFAGSWHVEGTAYSDHQRVDDPFASATPWTGEETYAWMPGGRFLMHQWDARIGLEPFRGTEIIGRNGAGGYVAHLFDDRGHHRTYEVAQHGPIWTFSEPETRATITIDPGGARLDIVWQWKNGGTEWLPLCDRVALRTG